MPAYSGEAKEEAAAIAAIEKLGGRALVDEKGPEKLVVAVDLYGRPVTDAGPDHLKKLTNLQSLDLGYTKATDAGLLHLKGLTH